MIEELKKERAKQVELVGKAHQEAEDAEQRRLQEQIALKERQLLDQKQRNARGAEALMRERQLLKDKRELEEKVLCIQRKKAVQQSETQYAHDIASKQRETKAIDKLFEQKRQEMVQSQQPPTDINVKDIDYTKSRFHMVAPQDNSLQIRDTKLKQLQQIMKNQENMNRELQK